MILCQKKLISVPELILARAFASIHLEKYSKATVAKQRLPGAGGNGLTISTPNRYKGQVGMMDLVGLADGLCFLQTFDNFWMFSPAAWRLWLPMANRNPALSLYAQFCVVLCVHRTIPHEFCLGVPNPVAYLCI